jgi:hypothetical protein
MAFPEFTIQRDLEGAILDRLRADPDLSGFARIESEVDDGRETQKGRAYLGVTLQDISSAAPGTGGYIRQEEEVTIMLSLGVQGSHSDAHRRGWEVIRHCRTLVSGLTPILSDGAFSIKLPGFFHIESATIGRDSQSQATVFASLYQINLSYSQRSRT